MKVLKNILMIASDNNLGSGAFRSMAQLCESLNLSGEYKVIVILPKKGNGISLLQEKSVEYKIIRSYSWTVNIADKNKIICKVLMWIKLLLNNISIYRIKKIISLKKIDIVHINTIWSYVGAKAALSMNKKLVWHIREALESSLNRCLFKESFYSLINRSDKVICISDYIRQYYSGKIDTCKMDVIYNGIDPDHFYIENRDIFLGDKVNILNIGTMNSNKRQEDLIVAAKKLCDDGISDFHISFVGKGRKEEQFKEMCKNLGLADNTTFCGIQKNIIDYYKKNDVLITSGDYGAFGRTTVEGMLAGCLVIGNSTGATSELLIDGELGYLYDPSDEFELYRKLKYILTKDKTEIREIARKGQKYALEHYSSDTNAFEVRKVYKQLFKNN